MAMLTLGIASKNRQCARWLTILIQSVFVVHRVHYRGQNWHLSQRALIHKIGYFYLVLAMPLNYHLLLEFHLNIALVILNSFLLLFLFLRLIQGLFVSLRIRLPRFVLLERLVVSSLDLHLFGLFVPRLVFDHGVCTTRT